MLRACALIVLVWAGEPVASFLAQLKPRIDAHRVALPRPAAPLSRVRTPLALADDDEVNGYRELGLSEDATYDEIMDAFMSLSETYSDDPGLRGGRTMSSTSCKTLNKNGFGRGA